MITNEARRGVDSIAPATPALSQPSGSQSAVSWGAVFAGATGAASLSLILLVLGVGLGMSSISPWSQHGLSATAVGVSAIVWLTVTQLLASGMGGYIAGRLRTKWVGTHTDEVYFRDTAHGFIAWSVATLITAAALSSVIGSITGAGVEAGASVAGGAATAATAAGAGAAASAAKDGGSNDGASTGYFIDSLFRKDTSASTDPSTASPAQSTAEVGRIFAQSLKTGTLAPDDQRYVGQLVAQRTGLSQQDAEKRVTDTFTKTQATVADTAAKAKEAADKARKATSYASLWLFVSLLIGAFTASLAATYGGRRRDL